MVNTDETTVDYVKASLFMWGVLAEGGPFHARGHFEEYHDRLIRTGRQEAADALARKEESYKPVTKRNEEQ